MKPSALTALFLALALVACYDDEHTSNVPPDLRLEDVVGCWSYSDKAYCALKCFDPGYLQLFQDFDSTINKPYESSGTFKIRGFSIVQRAIGKYGASGIISDTIEGETKYRRVDKYLYTLDDNYQLAKRYDPVTNLDSLPCGQPFTLLPKPANWTLF